MTLITLITVNAVAGAALVYGLVAFLAFGIRSDRPLAEGNLRFPSADLPSLATSHRHAELASRRA